MCFAPSSTPTTNTTAAAAPPPAEAPPEAAAIGDVRKQEEKDSFGKDGLQTRIDRTATGGVRGGAGATDPSRDGSSGINM